MGSLRNRQLNRELGHLKTLDDTLDEPDKRSLIFLAVRKQVAADHKAPWSLSQKLNAAPYRYGRDVLWASLLSISKRLRHGTPRLDFGVEGDFIGEGSFGAFVDERLTGTVSQLIDQIVECSRWPKAE